MWRRVVSEKLTDVSEVLTASMIRMMDTPLARKRVKKWEQAGQGNISSPTFFARGVLIALMMEEVSVSETSADLYKTTWRNIPEDGHLHIRRRENLKYRRHEVCLCEHDKQRGSIFYLFEF
jgi:hypothetical protein